MFPRISPTLESIASFFFASIVSFATGFLLSVSEPASPFPFASVFFASTFFSSALPVLALSASKCRISFLKKSSK